MGWTIGALHSLQQALRWDPRDAEVLVGTSAGAEVAALLGVERLRPTAPPAHARPTDDARSGA